MQNRDWREMEFGLLCGFQILIFLFNNQRKFFFLFVFVGFFFLRQSSDVRFMFWRRLVSFWFRGSFSGVFRNVERRVEDTVIWLVGFGEYVTFFCFYFWWFKIRGQYIVIVFSFWELSFIGTRLCYSFTRFSWLCLCCSQS